MSRAPIPHFTPSGLASFLIAPGAAESFSPAPLAGPGEVGAGGLVLDCESSASDELERSSEILLLHLPILPCVTIVVRPRERSDAFERLASVCDVIVDSLDELDPLTRTITDFPVASLAFVQLLRGGMGRSIYDGLVAESVVYSMLQAGAEFQAWRRARKTAAHRGMRAQEPACRMERDRGRLELWMTRPEKHNAFSRDMRDGLVEAFQLALADPTIDSVELAGEGPSFCSGGDLDEFGSFPNPAESHVIRTTRSPALLLSRLAERVTVYVHGACIGAGAELPAFTARVVASEDAFFQLPEISLGLIPGAGGTVSLPKRIGRHRTAWLGLSRQRIDAQRALDWGLVDEIQLRQHHRSETGAE